MTSFQQARFRHHVSEKSFWFQASVVCFATIATRSRRRVTRVYLFSQTQTTTVGTEFIFCKVKLTRVLMVFLPFRKSRRRWVKSWVNGKPVIYKCFGAKIFENGFHEYNLFHYSMDRLELTAVYCTIDEGCKHNISNDPFSRIQECATIWQQMKLTTITNTVWRQIALQKPRRKELHTWYYVNVKKPSDKTHDSNDNVTIMTKSTFHTACMNVITWIDARVIPCAHSPVASSWSSWFAHHRLQTSRRKFGVVHAWWNRTTRRLTPMRTWKGRRTQCTSNDTWQANVHVVFLSVLLCLASSSSLIAHRVARVVRVWLHSSHPCMKWASVFDFELVIPFNFLFSLFIFNLRHLLPQPWGQLQHCVLCLKGDGLHWRNLPPHILTWHCVLPLLSVVAIRTPWHARGWHTRGKPVLRCALSFWQPVRNVPFNEVDVWGPVFFVILFFTHLAIYLLPFSQFSIL